MSTISLTGNYGFVAERITDLAVGTTIDASSASFIQDNWTGDGGGDNPYPFRVDRSPGAIILGGTINGEIDQTADWRTVYGYGNSAGVRLEDSPNATIQDWRISNTWDAIRISWNSQNFLIEDVWVTNARDDAIENDRLLSGTIRDSLFDGVFAGLSIDPSSSSPVDGHSETVTLDGVLMRLQSSLYEGELTHASPIKTDSATNGTVTPNLRFINTVFAIEDVNHHSYRSMFDAWANTVESSGNYFLNLSDTPLPAGYPMPPAGWTVLQGQPARDYWQTVRAEWIDRHSDGGGQLDAGSGDQPVLDGGGQPVPDVGNISISDVTISEGDAGTQTATFTVSRTGTAAFAVDFSTADGTATAGSDYLATTGTLSFAADQASQTVSVTINGDTSFEPDETFFVNLTNATNGGTIFDDQGLGTITNDDAAPLVGGQPVPDDGGQPALDDSAPTFEGVRFEGNDSNETIIGNALDNFIDGDNGDDVIMGGAGNDILRGDDGNDILWGGSGSDVFFFKRTSDSRQKDGIDTIMDFTTGERIDLSAIDANRDVVGDQAFSLLAGEFAKPGQLNVTYDAIANRTVVTGNVDNDAEAEITIMLNGHVGLTESDFIL